MATPRTFGVTVRIRRPGNGVVPGRDEVQQAEEGLAWVLRAFFAHSAALGLKMPPFW